MYHCHCHYINHPTVPPSVCVHCSKTTSAFSCSAVGCAAHAITTREPIMSIIYRVIHHARGWREPAPNKLRRKRWPCGSECDCFCFSKRGGGGVKEGGDRDCDRAAEGGPSAGRAYRARVPCACVATDAALALGRASPVPALLSAPACAPACASCPRALSRGPTLRNMKRNRSAQPSPHSSISFNGASNGPSCRPIASPVKLGVVPLPSAALSTNSA